MNNYSMQEDTTKEHPAIPQEWLERAAKAKKRFENMTPEERKGWGFTENSLGAQKKPMRKKIPQLSLLTLQ